MQTSFETYWIGFLLLNNFFISLQQMLKTIGLLFTKTEAFVGYTFIWTLKIIAILFCHLFLKEKRFHHIWERFVENWKNRRKKSKCIDFFKLCFTHILSYFFYHWNKSFQRYSRIWWMVWLPWSSNWWIFLSHAVLYMFCLSNHPVIANFRIFMVNY